MVYPSNVASRKCSCFHNDPSKLLYDMFLPLAVTCQVTGSAVGQAIRLMV